MCDVTGLDLHAEFLCVVWIKRMLGVYICGDPAFLLCFRDDMQSECGLP